MLNTPLAGENSTIVFREGGDLVFIYINKKKIKNKRKMNLHLYVNVLYQILFTLNLHISFHI